MVQGEFGRAIMPCCGLYCFGLGVNDYIYVTFGFKASFQIYILIEDRLEFILIYYTS